MPHPFVKVTRRQNPFGVFPVEPLVRNVPQVAHLHRRSGLFDALGEVLDRLAVLKNGFDPLILEGVGELAQNREDIAGAV